jgi:hypothetical protein
MAARFGDVSFSGLAFLVIAFVVYGVGDDMRRGLAMDNDAWFFVVAVGFAVVLWLIGRACRYVLAGR